jgi:hypothetical protein
VCAGAGRSEGSAVRRWAAFSFIETDDPCIPWARPALCCPRLKSRFRSRECLGERRDPSNSALLAVKRTSPYLNLYSPQKVLAQAGSCRYCYFPGGSSNGRNLYG